MSLAQVSGGDPTKKKKNWAADDMKSLYKKVMSADGKPAFQIVKNAADKVGIDRGLLMSSAFQEGMNKGIARPDEISDAYSRLTEAQQAEFPVDGFYNYGLDTFGDRAKELTKYLPKDFDKRYTTFDAVQDNKQHTKVKTAAFRTNEDALIAKGAMMRAEMDTVNHYADKLGVKLDTKALDYFTLASYNGGFGNAKIMMDEYVKAGDKGAFIDTGSTSRKGIHKNIQPRMENIDVANSLLGPEAVAPSTPFNSQDGLSKALTQGRPQ